jgi:Ras-related protein Rab-1A
MSTGEQEYDYLFKLLLIGNSSVGKSSLLFRFVENVWDDSFVPTIGVDFKLKTLEVNGKKVKLQIWDTAGQERFKNITASYYRGGNGVLVVYDITERESFDNLTSWLIEIEKNANKNVYKLLIGNKCDLEDKRKVTYQEGKDFAESNGMKFIETSAKDNTKVQEAFELLTSEIMKSAVNKDKGMEKKDNTKQIRLSQNTEDISGKKKGGCC